jgi:spoIIIJ-associated protein
LEEHVEIAKNFTSELIKLMGFEPEVEAFLKNGEIYIEIKAEKEGRLIGKNGNTLDSLQFLINRMVNKRLKQSVRLTIDINHYRKRREDYLKKMALQWAENVKRKNKEMIVGPFNLFERKIIHTILKKDSIIKTESLGTGDLKKIKIIPIKEK